MVEINIWNDYSNKFTSMYSDYPRHPYCSNERSKYSYSKEYKEYARPFITVRKEMMTELPCGLLLGHIKMLWLISFDYINSNYRVASYFEYEYGIDFHSELLILENKNLIKINNDTKINKSTYNITDKGKQMYISNKKILELYELKKEFYTNSKLDSKEIATEDRYYKLFRKAFKYYFEDSNIVRELESSCSTETISKIKISINNIFSNQQNSNNYKNISIILSNSTGVSIDKSLCIVSSFSSTLNFFEKKESWERNNVKKYYFTCPRQLGINNLCIEDDKKIYCLTESDEKISNFPHCLNCKCHAVAFFSEQSMGGTVLVNNPVGSESFEMERKDDYKSWINQLTSRYGNEVVDLKLKMARESINNFSK